MTNTLNTPNGIYLSLTPVPPQYKSPHNADGCGATTRVSLISYTPVESKNNRPPHEQAIVREDLGWVTVPDEPEANLRDFTLVELNLSKRAIRDALSVLSELIKTKEVAGEKTKEQPIPHELDESLRKITDEDELVKNALMRVCQLLRKELPRKADPRKQIEFAESLDNVIQQSKIKETVETP